MSLSTLLLRMRSRVEQALREISPPYTLFFSLCDGKERASVVHVTDEEVARAWQKGAASVQELARKLQLECRWLRVDWVCSSRALSMAQFQEKLQGTKRNYFRYGLALDPQFKLAFLEQELNGNAMLYAGGRLQHAAINEKNFLLYARRRYGKQVAIDFSAQKDVYILTTQGVFCDDGGEPLLLQPSGLNAGRRILEPLAENSTVDLIQNSSHYLASQVRPSGQFIYGWHPCFDRPINTYNSLRHASSTYAMIEAWGVTRDSELEAAIERALKFLSRKLIRQVTAANGEEVAFLLDLQNEIKLGGNAVCLLAFTKYAALTGSKKYDRLLEKLALGIRQMQDPNSGRFVHVLQYPELSVKEKFRIIYYDGEAAFGLMRLYALSKDQRWLEMVVKAFDHFIAAKHWKAHDHWLSYCVNELTLYRSEERYYQFGLQNVSGYLNFVLNRITTFPTLLELMMATEQMVVRIQQQPELQHLLTQLDLDKFYRALEYRAHYLLNGHFWPEFAMYFKNPTRILGSFFIRHHAFRVRIDDVEHYLSGYVAYLHYLRKTKQARQSDHLARGALHPVLAPNGAPLVAWGGDVNLGRRQHYRAAELGENAVLGNIPALNNADLSIVNLECVVATSGEQGVEKGEASPYYYRARPEMLNLLAAAKIDVVTTANNHSGDYGPQALLEQQQWLDAVGIGHTGSGANFDEAMRPVIRPAGPLNVAIFSIDATQRHFAANEEDAGCAYLSLSDPQIWKTQLVPRIQAARQLAQIVLVAVHWGPNLERHPGQKEIAVGHAIIDAGADAVLGTSAHVLQGIEIYRQRPIIHDAGDLLFDSVRNSLADSGVFQLALSARGVERVIFVPVGVGFGFSRQLSGRMAIAASRRFSALCSTFGTVMSVREDGSGTIALNPPQRSQCKCPAAQATRYHLAALIQNQQAQPTNPAWQVASVPEDARIAPLKLGPLTLLGVRLQPRQLKSRQLLWVESFWTAEQGMDQDYRLDFRAIPTQETSMPYWGRAMDHDPCDWQMPTSRWQPGVIYRDFFGLRPPAAKTLVSAKLQLHIGLVSNLERIPPIPLEGFLLNLDMQVNKRTAMQKSLLQKPLLQKPLLQKPLPVYQTTFPAVVQEHHPGQTWNADQLLAVTGGKWLVPPPKAWFVRSVLSGKSFIPQVQGPVLFVVHSSRDRAFHEQSSKPPAQFWDLHNNVSNIADRVAGIIVARPVSNLPEGLPVLQVEDPIRAIIELGFAARSRFIGEVIAVTGTVGKSSTLKMIEHMLGKRENVLTTLSNYNSRVGAPSMLAGLSQDHEAAVIEVAQSALWMKQGPITRKIKPTIALITEIGTSQRVKSVEETAKWKSRIFDGLTGSAVAIVGEHLQCFDYVMEQAGKYARRVVRFGTSDAAEVQIVDIQSEEGGSFITLRTPQQQLQFQLPVPSMGMVHNAIAAISAVYAMGEDLATATASLQRLELDEGHLQRIAINLSGRSLSLIDDSWNAEVSSMLNAFSVLAQVKMNSGGRRIAVLGRIVHLDDGTRAAHESLAEPLIASKVDWVLTHGDEMRYLRALLPARLLGPHFSTAPDLVEYLLEFVQQSDLILLKGSRRDSDFGDIAKLLEAAQKQ